MAVVYEENSIDSRAQAVRAKFQKVIPKLKVDPPYGEPKWPYFTRKAHRFSSPMESKFAVFNEENA